MKSIKRGNLNGWLRVTVIGSQVGCGVCGTHKPRLYRYGPTVWQAYAGDLVCDLVCFQALREGKKETTR